MSPQRHSFLLLSMNALTMFIWLIVFILTWSSAVVSGQSSSVFSLCDDCTSLKKSSNHTGHCCCTPLLDIRCQHLNSIPKFSSDNPATIYSGIYISDQKIDDVPERIFEDLRVRKIMLNFNPIGDKLNAMALRGLEKIVQELYLGDCRIQYLPDGLLDKMEELRYVHLWQNSIEKIPPMFFKDCANLGELILWGNRIRTIDANTFAGLWNLRKLDLDKNKLSMLTKEAFSHMRNLEVLHLGENEIKILSPESFSHIPRLKVLSLDGNGIETIPSRAFFGLRGLLSLALNGNRIKHMVTDIFSNLPNLTTVLLQNNRIEDIWPSTFASLRLLQTVDLSNNRLDKIRDQALSKAHKLRYLYLDDNSIKTLSRCIVSKKVALKTLSLLGNGVYCDCRVTWLMDLYEREGVNVWGTCENPKVSAPSAIVSRFQYKVQKCKNAQVECKQ